MIKKIKEKNQLQRNGMNKHFVQDNQRDKKHKNIFSISSHIMAMQKKISVSDYQKPGGAEKNKRTENFQFH